MTELHVWLGRTHVATLTEVRGRIRLSYGAGRLGAPLVSVAMPVSTTTYTDRVVRPFFQGLLPEGPARAMIAHDLGVPESDDLGLLARLGGDCAGALVVLPVGETPPSGTRTPPVLLDDAEVERRLRDLPVHPLGVTGSVRASLPGVQPKLLLTREGDRWCEPTADRPSTHLLKTAVVDLSGSVENEALCLTLAGRAGLRVAGTSTASFGALHVLVSERYDRITAPDGSRRRLHQEDACQALSVLTRMPRQKYEAFGGPSLPAVAGVLRAWGGSPLELLEHLTFHVLVGNADAHGKNVSFLHGHDGRITLAPLYDVMCTTVYDGADGGRRVDTTPAMAVNGRADIGEITTADLVAEAGRWKLRTGPARAAVTAVVEQVRAALDPTLDSLTFPAPTRLVEHIAERVRSFR